MKILYLLSQRPEMTGSGVYVVEFMRCAAERGLATALLVGTPADSGIPEAVRSIPCHTMAEVRFGTDLPFPVTGMSDVMPYPSSCWRDLTPAQLDSYVSVFTRELERMIGRFKPDIIHTNHLWVLTATARRLFPDIPMVASCHGSDLRQFDNLPHLADRVRPACRMLDAVLALSSAQAQDIHERYAIPPERIHVTGAGYATSLFHEMPQVKRDPMRILYAGKLSRAKGVPWLLQACARLKSPFRLDLCGGSGGEDLALCETLAERLNASHGSGTVTLHGTVSQSRLADLMRQASVFVLPSLFEGVPLVLLEALACGCRLVATDLPGVREVFSQASPDLIRKVPLPRLHHADEPFQQDEEAFRVALAKALETQLAPPETPPDRLNPERARLLAGHDWNAVFQRALGIYDRVLHPDSRN